jgi:hypothetical protein
VLGAIIVEEFGKAAVVQLDRQQADTTYRCKVI